VTLSAPAKSLASDADRIWFVASPDVSGHGWAGYMTKDGATKAEVDLGVNAGNVVAIVKDPSVATRAWVLIFSAAQFRSIDVGTPPTLGTARDICGNPYDMAFGPGGNLFVTCGQSTIQEFTQDGVLQNTFTPSAGCGGPSGIMYDGAKLWFTAFYDGAVCTMVPTGSNTATWTKIASVAGTYPFAIATGPDGYVWAADYFTQTLFRSAPTGAATPVALPDTTSNRLRGIGVSSTTLFVGLPKLYRVVP
jgi:hypothetical protein